MVSLFKKVNKEAGQHGLEYIVLSTLIMAGIIIMGPYVIRSWNANLKGWEDSAIDSLQDPLLEDPVPPPMAGCDIVPPGWVDDGCRLGRMNQCDGTILSCSPVEMLSHIDYTPSGCHCTIPPSAPIAEKCTTDDCCCTTPVTTGRCGINVTFITGRRVPSHADCPGPPPYAPNMINKLSDDTCPDGMMEAWSLCGHDVDPGGRRYGCVPDPACVFTCTAPPHVGTPPEYGSICPNDDMELPSDILNSFVQDGECTNTKCETQCGVGFFAQGMGINAFCGPCGILGLPPGNCPEGQYDLLGCPAGQYDPACCLEPKSPSWFSIYSCKGSIFKCLFIPILTGKINWPMSTCATNPPTGTCSKGSECHTISGSTFKIFRCD